MTVQHITMTEELKYMNEVSAQFMASEPGEMEAPKMFVTSCQVYPLEILPGAKTRALCRVMLNGQFQLTGLRIVDGANNLFVSYPKDPGYKGDDYRSLMYPVTKELRNHIEYILLTEYANELERRCNA